MYLSICHPQSEPNFLKISKHRVREYVSDLTSTPKATPKAELFCTCKRKKFKGQNKVNILKL